MTSHCSAPYWRTAKPGKLYQPWTVLSIHADQQSNQTDTCGNIYSKYGYNFSRITKNFPKYPQNFMKFPQNSPKYPSNSRASSPFFTFLKGYENCSATPLELDRIYAIKWSVAIRGDHCAISQIARSCDLVHTWAITGQSARRSTLENFQKEGKQKL